MNNLLNKQNGQSLWEVIVALAITALVIIGLAKVTTVSLKGARYSSDQNTASSIAQKKIATLIDQKNVDWNTFFMLKNQGLLTDTSNVGYCVTTQVTDNSANLPTTTPNWIDAEMAKISVNVFWGEKTTGADCALKTCDSNYKDYFEHCLPFETYAAN